MWRWSRATSGAQEPLCWVRLKVHPAPDSTPSNSKGWTLVGKWEDQKTWAACSVVLPKSALSAARRQTPHGHGCQGPAALHSRVPTALSALSPSWALRTNIRTDQQLDLHFVQHTFHSTLHSHQEGGFAPLITANQQDKHYPRQSDFYKAKELETRYGALNIDKE